MTQTIDLNKVDTTAQQADAFGQDVFESLPRILSEPIAALADPVEKSVFLMGALGVVSGMLPNLTGLYDGMTVGPNLYVYIVGPAGSGKGALTYCRQLGQEIHRSKLDLTQRQRANRLEGEPDPPQLLHYVPANNSKSGMFELLAGNNGTGTLFESEGDSLSDAISKDYGNFSDLLRKAYHHEPISFYRRSGKEFVEVDDPRLSVVLSSTFDQMLTLIPNPENGLFSRFCFYGLPGDGNFRNVFAPGKSTYKTTFQATASNLTAIYHELDNLVTPIRFTLTGDQESAFVDHFKQLKTEFRENISFDLDGTVNRLAVQYFRIAMILTTIRSFGDGELCNPLQCTDHDFQLCKQIVSTLTRHAINIFLQLPQPKQYHNSQIDKAEDIKKAIELRKSGLSYGAIAESLFGNVNQKSTVYRWINSK